MEAGSRGLHWSAMARCASYGGSITEAEEQKQRNTTVDAALLCLIPMISMEHSLVEHYIEVGVEE